MPPIRIALFSALLLVVSVSRGDPPPGVSVAPAPPAPAPAPGTTWVVTPSVVSEYMLRGIRLGGAAFQPSVENDFGNWAVGVWASTPLANKVPGQSDPEIDPYGSYTVTLSDALNLQPGFILYGYPRAKPRNGFFGVTFEPSLAANYTFAGVTFTPKVYEDVVLRGLTTELSGAYAVPIKSFISEIDLAATAGTQKVGNAAADASPRVKAWGDYWLAGFWVPFTTGSHSKLKIGWNYTAGRDAYLKSGAQPRIPNPGAVGRGVAAVSWTLNL